MKKELKNIMLIQQGRIISNTEVLRRLAYNKIRSVIILDTITMTFTKRFNLDTTL